MNNGDWKNSCTGPGGDIYAEGDESKSVPATGPRPVLPVRTNPRPSRNQKRGMSAA